MSGETIYTAKYISPIGEILVATSEDALCGLWFESQRYYASGLGDRVENGECHITKDVFKWLDSYFSGSCPEWSLPISLRGTPFRISV